MALTTDDLYQRWLEELTRVDRLPNPGILAGLEMVAAHYGMDMPAQLDQQVTNLEDPEWQQLGQQGIGPGAGVTFVVGGQDFDGVADDWMRNPLDRSDPIVQVRVQSKLVALPSSELTCDEPASANFETAGHMLPSVWVIGEQAGVTESDMSPAQRKGILTEWGSVLETRFSELAEFEFPDTGIEESSELRTSRNMQLLDDYVGILATKIFARFVEDGLLASSGVLSPLVARLDRNPINPEFEALHPRGKDGKFIEKLGFVTWIDRAFRKRRGQVRDVRAGRGGRSEIWVQPTDNRGNPVGRLEQHEPQELSSSPKVKADLEDLGRKTAPEGPPRPAGDRAPVRAPDRSEAEFRPEGTSFDLSDDDRARIEEIELGLREEADEAFGHDDAYWDDHEMDQDWWDGIDPSDYDEDTEEIPEASSDGGAPTEPVEPVEPDERPKPEPTPKSEGEEKKPKPVMMSVIEMRRAIKEGTVTPEQFKAWNDNRLKGRRERRERKGGRFEVPQPEEGPKLPSMLDENGNLILPEQPWRPGGMPLRPEQPETDFPFVPMPWDREPSGERTPRMEPPELDMSPDLTPEERIENVRRYLEERKRWREEMGEPAELDILDRPDRDAAEISNEDIDRFLSDEALDTAIWGPVDENAPEGPLPDDASVGAPRDAIRQSGDFWDMTPDGLANELGLEMDTELQYEETEAALRDHLNNIQDYEEFSGDRISAEELLGGIEELEMSRDRLRDMVGPNVWEGSEAQRQSQWIDDERARLEAMEFPQPPGEQPSDLREGPEFTAGEGADQAGIRRSQDYWGGMTPDGLARELGLEMDTELQYEETEEKLRNFSSAVDDYEQFVGEGNVSAEDLEGGLFELETARDELAGLVNPNVWNGSQADEMTRWINDERDRVSQFVPSEAVPGPGRAEARRPDEFEGQRDPVAMTDSQLTDEWGSLYRQLADQNEGRARTDPNSPEAGIAEQERQATRARIAELEEEMGFRGLIESEEDDGAAPIGSRPVGELTDADLVDELAELHGRIDQLEYRRADRFGYASDTELREQARLQRRVTQLEDEIIGRGGTIQPRGDLANMTNSELEEEARDLDDLWALTEDPDEANRIRLRLNEINNELERRQADTDAYEAEALEREAPAVDVPDRTDSTSVLAEDVGLPEDVDYADLLEAIVDRVKAGDASVLEQARSRLVGDRWGAVDEARDQNLDINEGPGAWDGELVRGNNGKILGYVKPRDGGLEDIELESFDDEAEAREWIEQRLADHRMPVLETLRNNPEMLDQLNPSTPEEAPEVEAPGGAPSTYEPTPFDKAVELWDAIGPEFNKWGGGGEWGEGIGSAVNFQADEPYLRVDSPEGPSFLSRDVDPDTGEVSYRVTSAHDPSSGAPMWEGGSTREHASIEDAILDMRKRSGLSTAPPTTPKGSARPAPAPELNKSTDLLPNERGTRTAPPPEIVRDEALQYGIPWDAGGAGTQKSPRDVFTIVSDGDYSPENQALLEENDVTEMSPEWFEKTIGQSSDLWDKAGVSMPGVAHGIPAMDSTPGAEGNFVQRGQQTPGDPGSWAYGNVRVISLTSNPNPQNTFSNQGVGNRSVTVSHEMAHVLDQSIQAKMLIDQGQDPDSVVAEGFASFLGPQDSPAKTQFFVAWTIAMMNADMPDAEHRTAMHQITDLLIGDPLNAELLHAWIDSPSREKMRGHPQADYLANPAEIWARAFPALLERRLRRGGNQREASILAYTLAGGGGKRNEDGSYGPDPDNPIADGWYATYVVNGANLEYDTPETDRVLDAMEAILDNHGLLSEVEVTTGPASFEASGDLTVDIGQHILIDMMNDWENRNAQGSSDHLVHQ